MKKIFIISMLLLTGCATAVPNATAVTPLTIQNTSANIPLKPYLPVYSLSPTSSPAEVMRAYIASVKALNGWGDSLEILLQAYQPVV